MNDEMTKEARRRAILQFLDETALALPQKAIIVNLQRHGATFSERTCRRLLGELEDEGLVQRLDEPRTFFEITAEGRAYLENSNDTQT